MPDRAAHSLPAAMREALIDRKDVMMRPLQLAWLTVQGGLSWAGAVSVLSSYNPETLCSDSS